MQEETTETNATNSPAEGAFFDDAKADTGGIVGFVNGKPYGETVAEAVQAAADRLHLGAPWVLPLTEAALSRPAELGSRARFMTPWGNDKTGDGSDRVRHDAYVAYLRRTMDSLYPFLLPLFDNANALILIAPGTFLFSLPLHTGVAFEIPQLSKVAQLTPFSEPGEQAH